MDKDAFIAAFNQAAMFCRDFAQQFVIEDLPTRLSFDFVAAARTPNDKGLIKFYGGRLLRPEQLRHVEPVQARKYLWIDGKIPLWINLSVHAADAEFTFIEVCACDRLTDNEVTLYHKREGNPPFHVLGPALPATWVSLQESGKVSLAWRQEGRT